MNVRNSYGRRSFQQPFVNSVVTALSVSPTARPISNANYQSVPTEGSLTVPNRRDNNTAALHSH